ncbi:MAG: YwaF family protein, partial [Clostridia bacterium]|nr:YwaF family protein [Clostridia bacterium]
GLTVFIFPIALLLKNPLLKNFCYFVSSAGGLMALLIPTSTFLGLPIYHISALSFYTQHMIITLFGVLLVTLKIIKPTWKSALGSIGVMGVMTVLCHLVNIGVPALGLGGPECAPNYMFTVRADTNALLSMAYDIFPVKLAYLLLFIPLLLVICLVLLAPIYIPKWIKGAKEKKAPKNA